jgi:hypothetical protein
MAIRMVTESSENEGRVINYYDEGNPIPSSGRNSEAPREVIMNDIMQQLLEAQRIARERERREQEKERKEQEERRNAQEKEDRYRGEIRQLQSTVKGGTRQTSVGNLLPRSVEPSHLSSTSTLLLCYPD